MAAPLQPIELGPSAPAARAIRSIQSLVNSSEAALRTAFLEAVRDARLVVPLERLAELVQLGRVEEAIAGLEVLAPRVNQAAVDAYTASGANTALLIQRETDRLFDFNLLNARSVDSLARTRARLIRSLTDESRQAARLVLQNAAQRGLVPRVAARELRASLGLTPRQAQIVENYRDALQRGSVDALQRRLRDRRFDRTVRRAVRGERALTPQQIDRMVGRYRERWVAHRAETVALTEARRAVSQADEDIWLDAVDRGVVTRQEVEGIWRTRKDGLVRDTHDGMEGQVRPLGQPFRSDRGNLLRFPADPGAPAEETVNCRCVVARRVVQRRVAV